MALLRSCAFILLSSFFVTSLPAQQLGSRMPEPAGAPVPPNTHPVYQQLRSVTLSGETAPAGGVVLKRDAGTLTFHSGTFCFLAPVEGKVTGAVFVGSATLELNPLQLHERRLLRHLTSQDGLVEEFGEAVLRFTDGTYDEIVARTGKGASASCPASPLRDLHNRLRHKLRHNLTLRILADVLSGKPGELFTAFLNGRKYGSSTVFAVDPTVSTVSLNMSGDDVMLMIYDGDKEGVWASFPAAGQERRRATEKLPIDVDLYRLDTRIEKNGRLHGVAEVHFASRHDGLRVVPLDLFRTLRVEVVSDAGGQPLDFVQEDKDEDAHFAVILPQALDAGERLWLRIAYSGPDAVKNEGGGNYYPVARRNWYPSNGFDDYAAYEMRFGVPKGLTMVATGERLNETTEDKETVSHWRSEGPQTVAGFHFGRFKREDSKLSKDFAIEAYANTDSPNAIRELLMAVEGPPRQIGEASVPTLALGSMNTTGMMKKAVAEAELAVPLYRDYFGPIGARRLAVTQQAAFNYGQSWPSLVWLPISYYFDSTVRHQLGMDDPRGYFKTVGPHEIAHQWFGHHLTWASYRDQWMSEGFSELAASLFIQVVWKSNAEFNKFWDDQFDLLTEKNKFGNRAIDMGPVTMGFRLSTYKTGYDIYRRLIYPKGGYILHMLRMLMWDRSKGDERFKAMMHDFVRTYANQPVSTEDFKAIVEKHMTAEMDLAGNRRMDWFFDAFVYGTALPRYRLKHSFSPGPDGSHLLDLELTQSDVDENFRMRVPIYLELGDGRVVRLGSAALVGNTTIKQQIPLAGLSQRPKRAIANYYRDVLAVTESN